HLARIESKGYIRRDPTKPRAIEILDQSEESGIPKEAARYAPVIGKVTAGLPITAVENIEEFIPLPSSSASADDQLFVLIIEGESMSECRILYGDMVIDKQQTRAQNSGIVVAITVEDEATMKRFFKDNDHLHLHPENATMDALVYSEVTRLGKVIGLYR